MSDMTRLIEAAQAGDDKAAATLLPLVYDKLRKLAAAKMAAEAAGHTLDATALVHEAYLRLVGDQKFANRAHFFSAAAEAMRRILVENARRKRRLKRGRNARRVELNESNQPYELADDDVLAVDEALSDFERVDASAASLVKLHIFTGMTIVESAQALGISERSAYRDWSYARAWLARFLDPANSSKKTS